MRRLIYEMYFRDELTFDAAMRLLDYLDLKRR